jgi:CheY-like chemotaxis protein
MSEGAQAKRILVADDSALSRELMREILETEGYHVEEAANGVEALARIRASAFDLVLLDIQMPVMDGFGVVRELRRAAAGNGNAAPQLPCIVAVTAYAMQGDREKALAAGFVEHITKPVRVDELRAHVERLLSHRPV